MAKWGVCWQRSVPARQQGPKDPPEAPIPGDCSNDPFSHAVCPWTIAVAACCGSLAAWVEMVWPVPGSMVPAVTPDVPSPAKVASAWVAVGALVVAVADDVGGAGCEVAVEPARAEVPAFGVPP